MAGNASGYDLGCNIYSVEGKVFQIEYAGKAAENSGAVIGIKCKDGTVVGVEKLVESKLLMDTSNGRVFSLDHHAGLAVAGYYADGRSLSRVTRGMCEDYKEYYGVEIPPHMISNRLGQYMHAHTIYGGYRPYGVTAVLQAYDERDKQAYLHVVEPSGVHFRYHGCAIGKSQQAAKTEVEKLNFSAMTVREGLQEIARIIHTIHDEVKDKPFVFEAGWICEESGWKHQIVPKAVRDEAEAWGKARVEEADMSDDDE